jgi:hypothetical protein
MTTLWIAAVSVLILVLCAMAFMVEYLADRSWRRKHNAAFPGVYSRCSRCGVGYGKERGIGTLCDSCVAITYAQRGSRVLSSVTCYWCGERDLHAVDCPWNTESGVKR